MTVLVSRRCARPPIGVAASSLGGLDRLGLTASRSAASVRTSAGVAARARPLKSCRAVRTRRAVGWDPQVPYRSSARERRIARGSSGHTGRASTISSNSSSLKPTRGPRNKAPEARVPRPSFESMFGLFGKDHALPGGPYASIHGDPKPRPGGQSHALHEHAREVALIDETAGQGDLRERLVASAYQRHGMLDPCLEQPRVRS